VLLTAEQTEQSMSSYSGGRHIESSTGLQMAGWTSTDWPRLSKPNAANCSESGVGMSSFGCFENECDRSFGSFLFR